MKHEQFDVENTQGATVISLKGQFIGGDETDALRDVLRQVGSGRKAVIIMDFASVSYVNSAFLGVLLSSNAIVARNRGSIVLAAVPPSIMDVLSVTKLDLVFRMFDTVQAALVTN